MINKKNTKEQGKKSKHLKNDKKINSNKSSNYRGKKKNKKIKNVRKAKRVVITLLICLILILFFNIIITIQDNGGGLTGILATILGEDRDKLNNLEPIKILIMGESAVDDYKLADTIMIASYDPKEQKASIMSLPRDTYVGKKDRHNASQNYLASYKINTVFRNGTNLQGAIDRINDLTELNLENYVIIDTKGLIKLVDAIGGVKFDVPIDMDYDDTSQNLHIHLKAGSQLINGEKAEQLLRFRHNNDGSTYPSAYGQQDFGRMKTQRNFIIETSKQVLKPQNIFKIKQIIDVMIESIKTNMDINNIKAYVPYAVNFNPENIKTGMLPGRAEMCNGVSIYVADKKESLKLISDLFLEDSIKDSEEKSLEK